MLYSIAAISLGASCGAVLRWILSVQLNTLFPALPMGTLAANLIGGYLIGIAMGVFDGHHSLNPEIITPEIRLLIITGFLGGLTTFSTFSAEVTRSLQQGQLGWAFSILGLHVTGSILLTILGIATVNYFRG